MNDLKFAFRQLLKNPGFTAVAVLTLAIGIGANTAVFSLINAMLLRPLPYPDSGRLVRIASVNPAAGVTDSRSSDPNIVDWQERNTVFEELAAFQEWNGVVTINGTTEPVRVNWVTPNLLGLLGIQPAHGRLLIDGDMDSGIMLPYGLWQRRFAGDPSVLGQQIKSDGETAIIVGILPPDAAAPVQGAPALDQAFVAADLRKTRFPRDLQLRNVVGRLKPGVTVAQAQEELDRIAGDLEREYPDTNRGWGVKVTELKSWQTQPVRSQLVAVYAATAIILLIACLNVSNLMLIRGESRRKELAVRNALGCSRAGLVRQLLGESLILSMAGAVLGVLLALWCRSVLLQLAPNSLGIPPRAGFEFLVFLSALGATLFAALVSGLLPAWRLSQGQLSRALVESGRTASLAKERHGLLRGLVAGQIAVSTVLLAATALTVVSFQKLMRVDPGFDRDQTIHFRVDPYPTPERAQRIMDALSRLPGVQSVGGANIELLDDLFSNGVRVTADGAGGTGSDIATADYWRVTTDYFSTAGIPLLAGRWFNRHDSYDRERTRLVVINEALARRFFPNQDPVGQTIRLLPREGKSAPKEIIGVVGSIKHRGLQEAGIPILYVHAQDVPALVVRTAMNPPGLLPAIRQAIRSVDSELIITRVSTPEQIVARSLADRRFAVRLMFALAALGIALAALGLYGVMSYAVSRRTQEIGVRLALGAQRHDVLRLIVGQGMTLASWGVFGGLLAAVALSGAMRSLLFEVSPADPVILAAITVLLGAVAFFACWAPARRASQTNPVEALRRE